MQQTTNYNLNVIEQSDKILDSVTALGQNATSIDTILAGKQDNITIATSISSSSTNNEVAGAKAVYDATLDNYSTTEHIVGIWIDGKPLYEQTYSKTAPSSSGTFVGNDTWLGTDYDLLFVENALVIDTANQALTMPFITNGGNLIKSYSIKGNSGWHSGEQGFTISSNYSGVNGCTCYITIRYTKTTDTATRSLNLMKSVNEEKTEEKELEEKEPIEEVKQEETKEPILEEKAEAEGSGDAR